MKLWLSLIFIFCTLGCTTTAYYIEGSNLPVPETRKVITALIGKPRIISLNGRELTSVYHNRAFEPLDETKGSKIRYYTKVTILGPRRPYEVSVQVIREAFDIETRSFVDIGIDEGLTKRKAIELKRSLNESLETYQTIDAEEVF